MSKLAYLDPEGYVTAIIVADPSFDPKGVPVPANLAVSVGDWYDAAAQTFLSPEVAPPSLHSAGDVNFERERRILAGRVFNVTGYGGVNVTGDDDTKTNLQGLAFAAQLRLAQGDTTTLTKYRDADNVTHELTPPQMIELWSLGSSYISAVMEASWDLKAQDPIPSDYTDDAYWP